MCLEFPRIVALILAASVGTVAAVVAGPLLTREGVNGAMEGDTSALWLLGAGLVVIAAFDFLGDYLRRFGAGRLSLWVQHRLRSRVFDSIQRLDGPGQDSLRTGQVVSRTNNDLQQVQQMLQLIPVPVAVVTYYTLGIAVMLWLSPTLTLIAVTVIGTLGLTAWRTRKRVFEASSKAQQDVGEVTEHIRSTISGISVVKSFAQEGRQIRWLEDACRRLFARRMGTMRAQAAPGATMLALPPAGQAALLLVGGWQVMEGYTDLGTFIAFSAYLGMLTGPTRVFASFLVITQRTRTCAERIFELIDARPEMHDGDAEPPSTAGISFDQVSFGYTSDQPVLHEVSFTVRPGETVAVVGASGSGKSTLALLAPRFYDAVGGSVRLGDPEEPDTGRDVRDLRLEDLRRQVGVVFEEPFLFRATVRENIAYGHDGAGEEEIRTAAEAAGAHEFIRRLEHGYDTEVSEGGRSLSGGQRQRIALARALLTRPQVLVVDDATSAVDAATEAGINEALRSYAGGSASADNGAEDNGAEETFCPRSTLLIARRRSTLDLADRIVVLEAGRTVGVGTRQELEESCPQFCELLAGEGESIDSSGDEHALWGGEAPSTQRGESDPAPETPDMPPKSSNRRKRFLTELPDGAAEAAASDRTTRVFQLLGPVKGVFAVALLLIAFTALVQVMVPVLVQRGIDTGIAVGDFGTVALCAVLAWLLIGVDWFSQAGQMLTSSRGSEAVQYGVRVRSFRHVLGFGLPYFEREQGGQVITRLTVDVDSLARFLQNGLAQGVMSLATIGGIGIAMLIFHPVLALIALSPLPLIAVATVIFRRLSSRAYDKARDDIGKVNSSLQENISGLRTVQSHGRQDGAAAFFRRISDRYRISREKAQKYIALYFPFVVFCSQLSNALVMVAGAYFVAAGTLSPGVLAAFLLFLGQFYAPLQQLANIFDAYQQARIGQRRTDELLATPPEESIGEGDTVQEPNRQSRPQGTIRLRRIAYTHQGSPTPALRGADLDIPEGQSLAVVGTTGAGKTTLIKVLAGLYMPHEGTFTVGGEDALAFDRAAHRRMAGVVPQEPHLFDSTVAENIRFARPEATDAEVEEAARAAGALPAVARLSEGFRHRITDGGANLAAGQRQLIALSRAHLAGADLLLLDEATSHLDSHAEAAVMRAVADGGRTTVIVAHRLTTAARCDRIAVMELGRVVEYGTHRQLLDIGGEYARLWAGGTAPDPAHLQGIRS